MQHITLTTEDCRWSPRYEVDDAVLPVLVDHLALARRQHAPIPGQPDWTAHATDERNVLMITICRGEIPMVTCAVVPADGHVQRVAGRMTRAGGAPREMPQPGPWCLVRLYDTIALLSRDEVEWLGDYERCVAWAWLDTPRTEVQ